MTMPFAALTANCGAAFYDLGVKSRAQTILFEHVQKYAGTSTSPQKRDNAVRKRTASNCGAPLTPTGAGEYNSNTS
jgi:hypothetical protein